MVAWWEVRWEEHAADLLGGRDLGTGVECDRGSDMGAMREML